MKKSQRKFNNCPNAHDQKQTEVSVPQAATTSSTYLLQTSKGALKSWKKIVLILTGLKPRDVGSDLPSGNSVQFELGHQTFS